MNLNQPIADFLFESLAEYRKSLGSVQLTRQTWTEHVQRSFEAWEKNKKPKVKKKPRIDAEDAWVMSMKADPRMEGVDVDKEIANCRFLFANKPQPIVPSRMRIVNWLLKADKTLGGSNAASIAPKPFPGPLGWLKWARENLPDWRRFADESEGRPVPQWHLLEPLEQQAIRDQMRKPSRPHQVSV